MSTTTSDTPLCTPETRIGDIVAARPALARIFERLGIDYCCGGKQTLAAACRAKGLEPQTVAALLEAAVSVTGTTPAEVDAAGMTLTQLADHIEVTHHAYLKTELPRLVEMSERVARKHSWRDARLPEMHGLVVALTEEMLSHMEKEERILFPLVRQIDAGAAGPDGGGLAAPIRQMEVEHDSAGRAIARLRVLTDGFAPGPDACNTHRALLAGLAEFETDLHRHVHKENNVLFPRALDRAAQGAN
jgi:regulator of cell morphogenesis and NO signaling